MSTQKDKLKHIVSPNSGVLNVRASMPIAMIGAWPLLRPVVCEHKQLDWYISQTNPISKARDQDVPSIPNPQNQLNAK